jgi:hypothetical protein
MEPDLQFLLATPLLLCALILVNAVVEGNTEPTDPPSVRSIVSYCTKIARTNAEIRWKKQARYSFKIIAGFFMRSGVVAPTGLCVDCSLANPENVRRNSPWAAWLGTLNHDQALTIIATNLHLVSPSVFAAVEFAYNTGIAIAATCLPEIARLELEPGQLAQRFRALESNIAADLPHAYVPRCSPRPVTASSIEGGFFYTMAGTNQQGQRMV